MTIKKQFFGFVLTGLLSTLLMFLTYVGLNFFINYQLSYAFSYVLSVLALYFMNNRFIFHRTFSMSTFLKFPLIYLLQYLIGAFTLEYLVKLGVPVLYAPLVIIIILLPLTFFLNRVVLLKTKG